MAEKDNQSKRLYQMNAAQFFTSLQGLQRRNFILSCLDNLVIKMTLKFVLNLGVTSFKLLRLAFLICPNSIKWPVAIFDYTLYFASGDGSYIATVL